MSFLGEVFLSEVLNKPVINQLGEERGRLYDVAVVRGNPFPRVTGLCVRKKRIKSFVPLEYVDILNKKVISIRENGSNGASALKPLPLQGPIFIREQLLDKQIVDINGVKVVRVNDIKLGEFQNQFSLLGLDVGLQGIFRRLGLEKKGSGNLIPWNYVQPLEGGLNPLTLTLTRQSLAQMHPVDIADIITQISSRERTVLLQSLDRETAGEAIHELEADVRAAVVGQMDEEEAADVLEKMQPDEAADVLGDLSAEKAKSILNRMEKEEAADVEELLEHDEDTAGGLMTTEFLCFTPDLTVTEAIEQIRAQAPETELIYYIYVVDDQERLLGVLSLRDLIIAPPAQSLKELMRTNPKKILPETNQKEVAELVSKYNLVAVPVVDEEEHLLGVITVDDILNVLLPLKRY